MQSAHRVLHPEHAVNPDSNRPVSHKQSPFERYLVEGHVRQFSDESQVLQRYGQVLHCRSTPSSLNPELQVHVPSLLILSSYV